MTDVLTTVKRDERGTKRIRRLRATGMVPAILYGHGKESVSLSIPAAEFDAAMRHGSHVVTLKGDVSDEALIKDVQWDAFGSEVLHVDFTRVSQSDRVEVSLPVELRGEAPGAQNGGIIELVLHEVTIECPVSALPDKLEVKINDLDVGDAIHVSQLELPARATLVTDEHEVVVHCVQPTAEPEEEAEGGAPSEPELVGRKSEDEEDSDE